MTARKARTHVSEAPTNPGARRVRKAFDVADLYRGPVAAAAGDAAADIALDEKLRQAYFWIVNNAIISPHYDIEFNEEPCQSYSFGSFSTINLPTGQSYSSFVLMPLLNFAARRRCLLVGGPGRGKTASAVLMAVLAGYGLDDIRPAIQKGQPQMTLADLLGNPLPADLVNASSMDDIRIAWRPWLGMRVKIIDEYNRIPTRTQSALLTIMADNYAEILGQVKRCPEAAWYLTANDDAGGGTYQVIEALQDRIDIVVKALSFNTRFVGELLTRIEEGISPEQVVPRQVVFNEAELERMNQQVLAVSLPRPVLRRLEFFASHFDFFERGGEQLEYKSKDTVRLAAVDLALLRGDEGKDRLKDLGDQTGNGLSVRGLLTAIVFVKALAYFRGKPEVSLEDVRQVLPFVLHDKLSQDPDSPFFEVEGNEVYRVDKVSWIRRLLDLSCAEFDRLDLDRNDPVEKLSAKFDKGLEGLSEAQVRKRLTEIERTLAKWAKGRKLYGHVYDDVVKLKYLHQRYTNYLRWLRFSG